MSRTQFKSNFICYTPFKKYSALAEACIKSIGEQGENGNRFCNWIGKCKCRGNKYNQLYINIREVVHVKPDIEKIIQVLISLLEEQEGVTIEYELEKIVS